MVLVVYTAWQLASDTLPEDNFPCYSSLITVNDGLPATPFNYPCLGKVWCGVLYRLYQGNKKNWQQKYKYDLLLYVAGSAHVA